MWVARGSKDRAPTTRQDLRGLDSPDTEAEVTARLVWRSPCLLEPSGASREAPTAANNSKRDSPLSGNVATVLLGSNSIHSLSNAFSDGRGASVIRVGKAQEKL